MKINVKMALAFLALALPLGPATAQEANSNATSPEPAITLQSDVMAIVTAMDANGQAMTKLVAAEEFTTGTKLSFGMIYSNAGTQSAANVTGTSPINPAVRLAPDADPDLIVSVDDGATFGTLSTRFVTTPSQGTRAATHADVTHVRWTIASIAPGESGRIAFPVIIR